MNLIWGEVINAFLKLFLAEECHVQSNAIFVLQAPKELVWTGTSGLHVAGFGYTSPGPHFIAFIMAFHLLFVNNQVYINHVISKD